MASRAALDSHGTGPVARARYNPLLRRAGTSESNGGSPVSSAVAPPALHLGSASSTMGGVGLLDSATHSMRASGANGTTGLLPGLTLVAHATSPGAQVISTVACAFDLGQSGDAEHTTAHAAAGTDAGGAPDPFGFCLDVTGDDDDPLAASARGEGASGSGENIVPTATSTPSPFGSGASRANRLLRRLSMDTTQLCPDMTLAGGRGASGSVRLGRSPSVRALNDAEDASASDSDDSDDVELPLGASSPAARTTPARKKSHPVAVKTIAMADEDRKASAESEMNFAKRVNVTLDASDDERVHPRRSLERQIWRHVAQLYSTSIDDTECRCTVVTEALYGGTLLDAAEKLAVHEMDFARCAAVVSTVAREVLAAVGTLHSTLGVFHNDLKLDNAMLIQPIEEHACGCFGSWDAAAAERSPCTAPHVKVIDFGCAAVVDPAQARDPTKFLQLPQRGSLGAMSPERLRGEAYGASGDVWSIGVLLLQLARGGRHPFLNPPSADEPTVFTAAEQRFWHLAKVLQFTEDIDDNRLATAAAVAAACDDTPLRGDAGFRAFVGAAVEADPRQRASVVALQRHPWLQQAQAYSA